MYSRLIAYYYVLRRKLGLRRRIVPNDILFYVLLVALLALGCHGKDVGLYVLEGSGEPFEDSFNTIPGWTGVFTVPLCVLYLKTSTRVSRRTMIAVGGLLSLAVPGAFQVLYDRVSIMIYSVHTASIGASWLIVFVNRELQRDLDTELVRLVFDKTIKISGFIVALFVAGTATLRFVSRINDETMSEFTSTFYYPTLTVAGIIFMIGYWILLPCWERLVAENA